MRFLCFLIIVVLLLGCKSVDTSDNLEVQSTDLRQEVQVENPQIVFIYFEIEKKLGQNDEIRLLQTQISEGRMKENTIRPATKNDGNLIIHLLDENNNIQLEQVLENPLQQTMEGYSESGKIHLNELTLEEAQFYIRFNHQKNVKFIKIYSIQSGKPVEIYHKPIQL